MKKTLLLIAFFSLAIIINAQKNFNLSRSEKRISYSSYNNFAFLDSRPNPDDMGFVLTSIFNKYTPVAVEKPLSEQFYYTFLSIIDSTAQSGTILVQLRNLRFREETGSTSEKGFCNIRMSLYEEKDSAFHFINTIDTIVMVKAMDVTGKLLETTSKIIVSQLRKNLAFRAEDYSMPFTLDDLANIDELEKNSIPIYNTDVVADGLYPDFKSFAYQTPSHTQLQIKRDHGIIQEIKIPHPEKSGKWKKIKPKDYYIVVVDSNPFLMHANSYFPIIFENGNYFVRTYIHSNNNHNGVRIGLAIGFGMIGGLFGSFTMGSDTELATAKLDHINGDFIIQ